MRLRVLGLLLVALCGCPDEPSTGRAPGPAPIAAPPPPPPPAPPPPPEEDKPGWVGLVYGGATAPGPGGAEIVVRNVVPGSPADDAGVTVGEWILTVDGRPAPGPAYLQGVLDQKKPGGTLRLELVSATRDPRQVTLQVTAFDPAVLVPRAIGRGADLLAQSMRPEGGWVRKGSEELGVDVALSALCARALAELPDDVRGPAHVAAVDSAVRMLLAHQTPDGGIVGAPDRIHHRTYASTLTLQVLARLKTHPEAAKRLRDFLVAVQLDDDDGFTDYDFAQYGAWNYFDHNRRSTIRADVSATAYAATALAATGIAPTDSRTVANALLFLQRTQNLPVADAPDEERPLLDGGFAFAPRDSKAGRRAFPSGRMVFRSYGSATSDGLRALLSFGVPADDARVVAAAGWLGKNFDLRVNPGFPKGNDGTLERGIFFYYLDAMTDALDRLGGDVLKAPGGREVRWRDDVARRLVSMQRPDGAWVGEIAVMNEDDPAQATAFAVLALTRCIGGGE